MTIENNVNEAFKEGYITVQDARAEMREMYGEKAFPEKETYGGDIPNHDFIWYKGIYEKVHETKPLKKALGLIKNFLQTAGLGALTAFSGIVAINLLIPSNFLEIIGFTGAGFATYFFGKNTIKSADKFSDTYFNIKEDFEYLKTLKDDIYKSIDDVL